MGTLLTGKEKSLFDSINREILGLAGADNVVLWSFLASVASGDVDPLYAEPVPGTNHYAPYKVLAYFERPAVVSEGADGGLDITLEGRVYFSRRDLEVAKVIPEGDTSEKDLIKPGDIFELFSKGRSWYFELKNVERDGFVNDSEVFTQYVCDFERARSFIPERKLPSGS